MESIGKVTGSLSAKYEKFQGKLLSYLQVKSVDKNLIKKPAYFENPYNPKCIDLIMRNRSTRFCVIEAGLSDFHKMKVLQSHVIKSSYFKL